MVHFRLFDPQINNVIELPNTHGNYIVCLRTGSSFPKNEIEPVFCLYENLQVLYTGISTNLRNRDYRQHFNGHAGRSTLRKSIGVLFRYKQIPRDSDPSNGKTKFCDKDENDLSQWMKNNLILYYTINLNCAENEQQLIDGYNPPLNISKNRNPINFEFREMLSALRRQK